MANHPPPADCANCGSTIPRSAKACPDCGADERTGWRESDIYDGLDLPHEAWSEDLNPATERTRDIAWYWWATGIGLFIALLLTVLGLR